MARVAVYVDGFNVYHAIDRHCPQYHWLDYHQLAQCFTPPADTLVSVVYFSAYAKWKIGGWKRHQDYVRALDAVGVEAVLGHFKATSPRCPLCKQTYLTHEEKRTDVNIALRVVRDAILDVYDRALILSADGDLEPVWPTLKALHLEKRVGIVLPIGTQHTTLERAADFTLHLREAHLRQSQFPDVVVACDGTRIPKADEYRRKAEEFLRRMRLRDMDLP